MSCIDVRTQNELDEALKRGDRPHCVGDALFVARESAHVEAWGSAHVEAWGSAHVVARGSAHVVARESAHVVAWESAHVEAWGSAHVVAWESAHVVARESAQLQIYDRVQVKASKHVAISRHSPLAKVEGEYVLDIPPITTAELWCDFYGVEVKEDMALLFKAVGDDFKSPHGFPYLPGSAPSAGDWDGGRKECGGGLHFSPSPRHAREFNDAATKYVRCPVALSDIVVHHPADYPQKIKASRVCAPIEECDIDGNVLAPEAAA